ncbi:MAG: hypothetical protein H5U40_13835 [Polyangiaceae bacterium]|nr:hypothetical protein [Polyangiaceae bacterium]
MRALKVYYSPSCAFSAGTVSFLLLRGADFELINLDEHPDQRDRLENAFEGETLETPVIEASGEGHIAPPLSELKELLESWCLPTNVSPHEQLKHPS